jgi:hypothetical protein
MSCKYLGDGGIYNSRHRPHDSTIWDDMLHMKQLYLRGRRMMVGNGRITDFWGDSWCGFTHLKEKFRELFYICNKQSISVATDAQRGRRFTFRCWLPVNLQMQMGGLGRILARVQLAEAY